MAKEITPIDVALAESIGKNSTIVQVRNAQTRAMVPVIKPSVSAILADMNDYLDPKYRKAEPKKAAAPVKPAAKPDGKPASATVAAPAAKPAAPVADKK